jgi:hypothetical protein
MYVYIYTHIHTHAIIWNPLEPYGTLWNPMGSYTILRLLMETVVPYGPQESYRHIIHIVIPYVFAHGSSHTSIPTFLFTDGGTHISSISIYIHIEICICNAVLGCSLLLSAALCFSLLLSDVLCCALLCIHLVQQADCSSSQVYSNWCECVW